MCRCNFCGREFENAQGVRAHLKTCENYQHAKKSKARRVQPLTASAPQARSTSQGDPTPNTLTTPSDLVANLADQFTRQLAGPDEATREKQKREALLAGLCTSLVDWYHPTEGVVTPDMAVAAKVALLDELGALPIDELPQAELTLRGTAIRNRVLAPYLRQQHEQKERQTERQHQDALRRQQESDIRARQTTRKAALVELGVTRALKAASSRGITGPPIAALEWEVRARLETLLVGDETEPQVNETIEASIERPLLEWAGRIEQIQSAKRERLLNQCLTLALPVAEATWPWVNDALIKQMCAYFGIQPPPQPNNQTNEDGTSSETQAPTSSEEPTPQPVRRRRVRPSRPIVKQDEMVHPSEPAVRETLAYELAVS